MEQGIPDLAQVREALAPIGARVREVHAAVSRAWAPIIEWAQTPEGRAALARYQPEEREGECHCLCTLRHPGREVCKADGMGMAPESQMVMVRFDAPSTGLVDVPMCRRCAEAAAEKTSAR